MTALLQWLFSLQIQICIIVVAVLLLRFLLRKAPKIYSYLLWMVVFIRLLCPITPEVSFSLIPSQDQILQAGTSSASDQVINPPADHTTSGILPSQHPSGMEVPSADADPESSAEIHVSLTPQNPEITAPVTGPIPGQAMESTPSLTLTWDVIAPYLIVGLWLAVGLGLILYNLASLHRLKKILTDAQPQQDGCYVSHAIDIPFVLGILSPKVYLPAGISGRERTYILAHERTHLTRRDYLIKPLCLLLSCLYWFNPFVWIAFFLMGKDMEMSCDEQVLEKLGADIKADYSQSLLQFASGRKNLAVPLAFGENSVKSRVRNVLNFQKSRIWVTVIATLLCIGAVVLLCTTRSQKTDTDGESNTPPAATGGEGSTPPAATGGEGNTSLAADTESNTSPAAADEEIADAVLQWANAFVDGDVETLVQMSWRDPFTTKYFIAATADGTPDANVHNMILHQDTYEMSFQFTGTANQVLICYPIWQENPAVTMLVETLSYAVTEEGVRFDHEALRHYNRINTASDFQKAYMPGGTIQTALSVHTFNDLILERMAKDENAVSAYCDPGSAAKALFHLGDGQSTVTYLNEEQTVATVTYTFDADLKSIIIPMYTSELSFPIWYCGDIVSQYGREFIEDYSNRMDHKSFYYKNTLYCVYSTGIYANTENRLQCLYSGYMGQSYYDAVDWTNGYFYFTVDRQHSPFSLDYADTGVIGLNLNTGKWEVLYETTTDMIGEMKLTKRNGRQVLYIYSQAKEEMKAIDLGETAETTVYDLPEDPSRPVIGRVYELATLAGGRGSFSGEGFRASWDMDMDGTAEEISITLTEGVWSNYDGFCDGRYQLQIGDAVSNETYCDALGLSVQIISLNGAEYLLMLYDDGPSGDPETTFYRYRNGKIEKAGTLLRNILDCVIDTDGVITGYQPLYLIQTEAAVVSWKMDPVNGLVIIPQDKYMHCQATSGTTWDITLKVSLPVHKDKDLESEIAFLSPQPVTFLYTDLYNWIYVEGQTDGQGGWMYVDSFGHIPEAGLTADDVYDGMHYTADDVFTGTYTSDEVFDGLNFAG